MKLGERGPFSRKLILPWLALPLLLASAAPATAQDDDRVGTLGRVAGAVWICDPSDDNLGDCRRARRGDVVFLDDTIVTGDGAKDRAVIVQDNGAFGGYGFAVGRDTELSVRRYLGEEPCQGSTWELIKGQIWNIWNGRPPGEGLANPCSIRTPTIIAGCLRRNPDIAPVRMEAIRDMLIRTYGEDGYRRIWGPRQTSTLEDRGIYEFRHEPESGESIVTVAAGGLVCETPGGGQSVIEAMEKMTVSPDSEAAVKPTSGSEVARDMGEILGDLADFGGAGSFAGIWSSTYGKELVLAQAGNKVTGSYESDNGQVIFTVSGDRTLEGFWIEDASGVKCGSAKEGRDYWGRLNLEFDDALTEYTGTWDYCGTTPGGGWYGSRVGPG